MLGIAPGTEPLRGQVRKILTCAQSIGGWRTDRKPNSTSWDKITSISAVSFGKKKFPRESVLVWRRELIWTHIKEGFSEKLTQAEKSVIRVSHVKIWRVCGREEQAGTKMLSSEWVWCILGTGRSSWWTVGVEPRQEAREDLGPCMTL